MTMASLIVCGLLWLFAHVSGDTFCPDSWIAYNGSCYLFAYDQATNFVEAEHFCTQHHGHLVEVGDVHENNFLHSVLSHTTGSNWWIGLSDQLIESEYKWLTSDVLPTYTDWLKGQPSPYHGHNEDCVIMSSSNHLQWSDVSCQSSHLPLCEIWQTQTETLIG